MANVFQDIFGGNTTSSQTTNQSTSTPQNMNPFTTSLGTATTNLGNTLAGGLPQYGGPTTAPITQNEQSLLGGLMTDNSQGGGVAGTNQYLTTALQGGFMPGSPQGNPFLSQAITAAQRSTMDNLNTTLSQSLPGYFTANGQNIAPNTNGQGGSSAFDNAAALATRSAAQTMGDIAANVSNNAYNTGVSQMQSAAALSQNEINTAIQNLQAQSLPRMIQDLGIQNGLGLFQENLQGVLTLLSTLGNTAKPVIGNAEQSTGNTTTTGSQTPGILPDVSQLIGSVGNFGKPPNNSNTGGSAG